MSGSLSQTSRSSCGRKRKDAKPRSLRFHPFLRRRSPRVPVCPGAGPKGVIAGRAYDWGVDIDVTEDLQDLAAWLDGGTLDVSKANWFQQGALWEMARVSGVPFDVLTVRLSEHRAAHVAQSMPPMRQPLGMPEPLATGGVISRAAAPIVGEVLRSATPPGVGIRGMRREMDLMGTDDAPPAFPDVSDEQRQMMRDVALLAAKDQSQAEHPSSQTVWADVPGASRFVIKREAQAPTPIAPDEPTAPPDPMSQGEIARRHGPIIGPATDEEMAELAAEATEEERAATARMAEAVRARTDAMKR